MAGETIPPVVIDVVGDIATLIAKIAEAKAALADFAKTSEAIKLGFTQPYFAEQLAKARATADTFFKSNPLEIPLAVTDLSSTSAQIVTDRALLNEVAKAHPIEMPMEPTGLSAAAAKLIADTTALDAVAKAHPIEIPVKVSKLSLATSAITGGLSSMLGTLIGGAGAGGARDTGIIGALLGEGLTGVGTAGAAGAGLGAGGLGIAGSVAGLGPEGLVVGPLLGVIGSAIGAAIGAGFLGIGAAGVGGTGALTNMAGMGQAISDIKKLWTVLQQVKTGAITAAIGMRQFNDTLKTLPAAAQGPALSFLKTLTSFAKAFDKLTGPAEAAAIHILTEFVGVFTKFLAPIGSASLQSMKEITKAIQPFLKWLGTTGVAMYKDIEGVALKIEPTGIKALTQGLELFGHVVEDVAPFLGHFVASIANWFTKLNTKTAGKLKSFIDTMVGDFQTWFNFLKSIADVGKTLLPDVAHVGSALIGVTTSLFKTLDSFIEGHQKTFKAFFGAHFKEMITGFGSIAKSLMPIIEQLMLGFINLAAAVRPETAVGLKDVANVIKYVDTLLMTISKVISGKESPLTAIYNIIPGSKKPGAKTGTLGQIESALGLRSSHPGLSNPNHPFGYLTTIAHALNPLNWFGSSSAGASTKPKSSKSSKSSTTTVIAELLGLNTSDIKKSVEQFGKTFEADLSAALKPTSKTKLATALGKAIADSLDASLKPKTIGKNFDEQLATALKPGVHIAAATALLGDDIHKWVQAPLKGWTIGHKFGTRLMQGIDAGITGGQATAVNAMTNAIDAIVKAAKTTAKIKSPSQLMAEEVGVPLTQGIALGITAGQSAATAAASSLIAHITSAAAASVKNKSLYSGLALPSVGVGGYGTGTGGAITIHMPITINAPTGNAPDIKRVLAPVLEAHTNQLVARFKAGGTR